MEIVKPENLLLLMRSIESPVMLLIDETMEPAQHHDNDSNANELCICVMLIVLKPT